MEPIQDDRWMMQYYDRDGNPLPDDVHVWGELMRQPAYKYVAKTEIADVEVSTVWLGMNHAYTPEQAPLIFETMVFGGKHDQEQDRYSTEAQALEGHASMVRRVRGWRFWLRPKDVLAERIAEVKS